jgi:serine/threonine protein kinase
MTNLIGQRLGKYELLERIACGGMAEVYRAFQPGIERQVVVKILHNHLAESPDFVARFQREARVIGSLQSPHIIRIIDMDVEGELYYMVMDFIQGPTFSDYLKCKQIMPVDEALMVGVQLASALDYAHAQGVLHRDIKPANIMFVDDSHKQAMLADFGLARICDDEAARLTLAGSIIGTPTYMSPEALRGEACDERSDIYSFGVVLYELVTGRTPYEANTPYSMMTKQASEPLPLPRSLNPHLPVVVEQLLLKALATEPDDRFQSGAEMVNAIRQAQKRLSGPSALPLLQVAIETKADKAAASAVLSRNVKKSPVGAITQPASPPHSPQRVEQANPVQHSRAVQIVEPAGWLAVTLASGGVAVIAFATIVLLLNI